MFCQYCGNTIPDDMRFCTECGRGINGEPSAAMPVAMSFSSEQTSKSFPAPKKRGKALGIMAAIIVILAAILAFLLIDPIGLGDPGSPLSSASVVKKTPENEASGSASAEDASSAGNSVDASTDSGYILPDSATRYYSESDLSGLSDWELYVARNEIFARHGRGFKNQDLANHFNGCSWYIQRYTPEDFDAMGNTMLNDYERKNADTIKSVEQARGSSYLS